MNPTISVITITFQAATTLERTIKSIQGQDYPGLEYIVVDGGSTDGTLEVIRQYELGIDKWISEPDKGLYDAMNKGMKLASGDYFLFINSGDELDAPNTLSKIFSACPTTADVYYGDTLITNMQGHVVGHRRLKPPKNLNWKHFKHGMLVSHQSIVVSRNIAPQFNLKYRYSADFDWCVGALQKSRTICNTQMAISRFLDGGLTKQNLVKGLKERFAIMCRYYGIPSTLLSHIPIAYQFFKFILIHKRF